jgi:hypothetical protein
VPKASEIKEQVARETERRSRLAVPAFAGGFLYLLSAIIISATLSGAPTVGLVQGLSPALHGISEPAVSPRTPEVKFISHHAAQLVSASVLAAIAVGVLVLILLLLADATSFRRPLAWRAARPLVLYGGIAFVIVSIGHQVVSAIQTHNFAVGHDHSNHAVDQALTKGTPNVIVDYVDLLAGLSLAAGTVGVALNAMRIGLLPRWMGFLGVFSGLLLFIPIGGAELQVLPALWMVMIGILFLGRWPSGTPPAWEAGEARPWPSAAQARAERAAGAGKPGEPAPAGAAAAGVPAPTVRTGAGASRKRRRKRGGRG